MNKMLIVAVCTALACGGMGFFAGMMWQRSQAPQLGMMRGQLAGNGNFGERNGTGNMMRFGGSGSFRPVVGEVMKVEGQTLTIKVNDGGSRLVVLSQGTTYSKTTQAAATDMKVGDQVAAMGTENSDGSITAQNIQLNPMFGMARITPPANQ